MSTTKPTNEALERERDFFRDALVKITRLNCLVKKDLPFVIAEMRKIARDAVPDYIERGKELGIKYGMKTPTRRRKMAAIIAPIPETGPGGKWLCVAIGGNLQWRSAFECKSENDAKEWLKKTRKHWQKFPDIEICHRLAPIGQTDDPA